MGYQGKYWKLKNSLFKLVSPSYWTTVGVEDIYWDIRLNKLLDSYEPIIIDEFTLTLGKTEVWYSNYPYANGSAYRDINIPEKKKVPLPLTRKRLHKVVLKKFMEEVQDVISN